MAIYSVTDVASFLCVEQTPVRECMARIDALGRTAAGGRPFQFLLVNDDSGRLIGTLTDGDIRRGILAGCRLEDPAGRIAFRTPKVGRVGNDPENRDLLLGLAPESSFLPVLDVECRVVEILVLAAEERRELQALVMAGGFGRRLGDRTRNIPKPLIHIGEKPILAHVIDRIAAAKPSHTFVSAHYLSEQIEHYVESRGDRSKLSVIREESPLGTAGCIGLLDDPLPCPLIVANGDILTGLDFAAFSRFFFRQGADALVAVARHRVKLPFGVVRSTPDGGLLRIDEKPTLEHFVVAGIYMLAPIFRSLIEQGEAIDMPALIQRGQERGLRVALFPLHEDWTDIGRPEDLARAETAGTPKPEIP